MLMMMILMLTFDSYDDDDDDDEDDEHMDDDDTCSIIVAVVRFPLLARDTVEPEGSSPYGCYMAADLEEDSTPQLKLDVTGASTDTYTDTGEIEGNEERVTVEHVVRALENARQPKTTVKKLQSTTLYVRSVGALHAEEDEV